ncbi:MAG: TolC family protein [Archangiaceae bacterium]|nr:TolC family protein [Archangiaceae bacterium]
MVLAFALSLELAVAPLTLPQALTEARARSVEVAVALARLEQDRGAFRSELSALLPHLDVGASVARNSTAAALDVVDARAGYTAAPLNDPAAPPGSLVLTPNRVDSLEVQPLVAASALGQLTVPVLDAPALVRTRAAGHRVDSDAAAARFTLEAAQVRVWQLMLAAQTAAALSAISGERLKEAREQQQAAEARFKAGELDRLGLTRAKGATAAADRGLRQAAANEIAARAAVAAALGRSFDLTLGPVPEPAPLEAAAAGLEPSASQRADLLAAREQLDSAELYTTAAALRFLPRADLNGQLVYGNVQNFAGANAYWWVQARLVWSLYDGGDRYGELHRRKGLAAEAGARLEQAEREAARQVVVARAQAAASTEALSSAQTEVKLARESLEAARAQFRVGALGYLELLDAQAARFSAEEALANERLRLSTARLDLALALGVARPLLDAQIGSAQPEGPTR